MYARRRQRAASLVLVLATLAVVCCLLVRPVVSSGTLGDFDTIGAFSNVGSVPECGSDASTKCWERFPQPEETGGCLASLANAEHFFRKSRGVDGKPVAVTLESHGWDSQDIINGIAAVVLQERMGYEVLVRRERQDIAGSVARTQRGHSHAVLEFWGSIRGIPSGTTKKCDAAVNTDCVAFFQTGYEGGAEIVSNAHLFESSSAADFDNSAYYDYYLQYKSGQALSLYRPAMNETPAPPIQPCVESYCDGELFVPTACKGTAPANESCVQYLAPSTSYGDVVW